MISRKKNGGFIAIAILLVMLFLGMASIALNWRANILRAEGYIAEGAGLMQVRNSLQKYAKVNKENFVQGKTVMYVNDQYAPTIDELTNLGYFTASGVDLNPYGATYATKLTLKNGAVEGMAYLKGSVKDASGIVDPQRACGIAKALGDVGLCTNPVNSAMLGNRTTQTPNPTGLKGSIGALIYVSP